MISIVDSLTRLAEGLVLGEHVPALRIAVVRDGEIEETGFGAVRGARFALASLSKPLVATACLVASEEGVLDLDGELRTLVPETGLRASIADLLAHSSGLPADDPEARRIALNPESVWADVAAVYVKTDPVAAAGSRRIYSNAGYALVALALERASDVPWFDYVREAVLDPLGMVDTRFGVPGGDGEIVEVREPGLLGHGEQLFNGRRFRALGLPQSGAFGTAADYARLLALYLAGGSPLLHSDTVRRATANHGGELAGGVDGFMTWPLCHWGLGFEIKNGKSPHWSGTNTSPRTFSHFGASGTLAFVDPVAEVGAVLLGARGTYSRWMLEPGGWPDLCAGIIASR
jgi:CubicO group peptidase (beta-lactamase class C family)